MTVVRPKKSLGQHFLRDQNTARKIVDSLDDSVQDVLEVGAGMGVLTRYLTERTNLNIHIVEIDSDSVRYLNEHFPEIYERIYHTDFLKWEPGCFAGKFNLIGNFPYNISSQIFFKILSMHRRIPQVVGMVQKEVAERISSGPGSKDYGILSVLLGAFYDTEYLFTVSEKVFFPPPKVKSAVIRLKHNDIYELPCGEVMFKTIVKSAFGQRRKMLRNSLKNLGYDIPAGYADKRPEQISVTDFIELTCELENQKKAEKTV